MRGDKGYQLFKNNTPVIPHLLFGKPNTEMRDLSFLNLILISKLKMSICGEKNSPRKTVLSERLSLSAGQ